MSHTTAFTRPLRRQRALPTPHRGAALVAALSVVLTLDACLDSSVTTGSTVTPAAMAVVSGDAQVGAAGNTLPVAVIVRVTDQSGVAVSGAAVSFVPVTASGTVSAGALFTDTSGSAGVLWTLGTAI